MTSELRKHVHMLYNVCDMMEIIDFHARMGFNHSPRLYLANDIMHYLCFLIAADDTVTWEEVAIVNEILEESKVKQMANPQELAETVRDLITDSFMCEIPESLKLFISFDLNAKAEKQLANVDFLLANLYIHVLKELGLEMIACDAKLDETEKKALQVYMSRLISYANNELEKGKNNPNEGTAFIGGKA